MRRENVHEEHGQSCDNHWRGEFINGGEVQFQFHTKVERNQMYARVLLQVVHVAEEECYRDQESSHMKTADPANTPEAPAIAGSTMSNSILPTRCSEYQLASPARAQETASIPNGRGGERLDHERREQLQHQRRGDNDRIAPPPFHLKITQWNVQGLSNKRHTVQVAAIAKNIDVFILHETLMSKDKQFRLPGYQQATIPSSEVEPVHCGEGVEAQAVRIHLANDSLVVYNIYKPPPKRLEAGELLTQATQELWCATFNAHTSLSELWRKLRIATRKLPRAPAHPQPLQEANRFAEHFAERSSSAQLPPEIRLHLQQVQLEREVVRVNMMRAMTGPKVGTGHVVLRTLYIHAIRSLTDYATPALNTLFEWQWEKLEVTQNNATSHCQGTYVDKNLKLTHGDRAELLTACFATKLITRAQESDIKNGLLRAMNLNRDVFNKKTWLLSAADAVNLLKLKDTMLSKEPDTMRPAYSTPAPWESPPAVFNILQTGTRKAD
ncbi:hypothetical protein Hamer_G014719, partial [Homarus americanus]